jgi:hypothetical protein
MKFSAYAEKKAQYHKTNNKGDRSDCNNYRGISLLNIAGKLFAQVALRRLHIIAENIYPESQCVFGAERSTMDMIFSLRQLQEKSCEQKQPLYIAFVDLTIYIKPLILLAGMGYSRCCLK